ALDGDAVTTLEPSAWGDRRTRGVLTPYFITQRWYQHVAAANLLGRATLTAATSLGGDFGFSSQVRGIEGGALSGLLKGVKLELEMTGGQTNFRARAVDFAADAPPAEIAAALVRELA